jgi:ABC-type glycerol-3-phosphate transport system substrate-binding protein
VEIDGQTPYAELREIEFAYTGSKYDYQYADGKVYLTAGEHTLGMLVEMPQMQETIAQVERIMDDLQDIGLSLQQVAGSDADATRTWEIEKYIPGVTQRLTDLQSELEALYSHMEQQYGDEPASSQNLKLAADILEQVLEEPERLPTRTHDINVGSSSATSYLAELINGWKNQGLSLDRIYLTGEDASLPDPNGDFFVNLINGIKKFFHSLLSKDSGYTTAAVNDDTVLTVWVNRSVQYVEMIQTLCDSRYEGYTDANGNKITIQFSVMPDEGKLLLANASNTGPDVALGVSGDKPYQLALRGAIYPLTAFEDFDEFVEGKFLKEAYEPFIYDDDIYAMPETQQFNVLMYRTDIMERLGLEIPRTWEDVANMMPALRRSGMNFYMPLSSQTGIKSVENIAVFFWQAAAAKGEDPTYSLYSEDGIRTTLNNETNIEAFQLLTDLYLLYGLQNNMPSFYNNFRYGVSPVGIGSFSNYVQMLYAAPEIADDWAIAPVPGFEAEDGTICNQMTTIGSSAIIMEDSDKKEAAWDFIKWWMSDETQSEFAQTLQSKFGSAYIWNSANVNAFSKLAIPEEDRAVILEQWQHTENIRHTPASYMLERSLSDAWYDVVNGHIPVRRALNEAAVNTQQELTIKLQEFDYVSASGQVIRPYSMKPIEEILELLKNNG